LEAAMNDEQFEALREWLSHHLAVRQFIQAHPPDERKMEMLREELNRADEEARLVLVDDWKDLI
jgi:hypothetical protein